MTPSASAPAPEPVRIPDTWPHAPLHAQVRDALMALPGHFVTETRIAGINATDIFTLNSALGATIEEQVVQSLNGMRAIWDADDRYLMYRFVRQPQTFPDVLLQRYEDKAGEPRILLGLELKGWYLLAKEGEPSFRFQVTPTACEPQDLIVIVPWVLSDVLSGVPKVLRPYIVQARYAAEFRNYHWRHLRKTSLPTDIEGPPDVSSYPVKSDFINDRPASDRGGNFGRLARTGIMDEYVKQTKSELIRGIEARHWLVFFKAFQVAVPTQHVKDAIADLTARIAGSVRQDHPLTVHVQTILEALNALLTEIETEE